MKKSHLFFYQNKKKIQRERKVFKKQEEINILTKYIKKVWIADLNKYKNWNIK